MANEKKSAEDNPEEPSEEGKPKKRRKPKKVELGGPGNPVEIHEDYLKRHLGGGAPATREAYGRAMEQWRKLPGAMVSAPRSVESGTESPDDEETVDNSNGESGQEEKPDDPKEESS